MQTFPTPHDQMNLVISLQFIKVLSLNSFSLFLLCLYNVCEGRYGFARPILRTCLFVYIYLKN
jgi:hypothetical protein